MMDDSSSADKPETFDSLVIAAERMLSVVFGSQIRFTSVERLAWIRIAALLAPSFLTNVEKVS